jgi:hypothetical protein
MEKVYYIISSSLKLTTTDNDRRSMIATDTDKQYTPAYAFSSGCVITTEAKQKKSALCIFPKDKIQMSGRNWESIPPS